MRQVIKDQITLALQNGNDYYLRELDIQIYIANHLINTRLFDRVFLEYHIASEMVINFPWPETNNVYIDIVVEHNGIYYPIEIKYKTVHQILPLNIFGLNQNINLGQHGAQNIGCYDFWKDVKRIEIFEQTFQNVNRGLVLFVSNDLTYKNPPLNENVGYAQFSIHNNRHIAENSFLNWNGNLAVANRRPGFIVSYAYNIVWNILPIEQHYYILI